MQVHRRLAFDENGVAGVQVFSTCRDSIRTLPSLCYDPQKCEDVDTVAEDHIYDEWRYLFMAHPLPAPKPKPRLRKYSPLDEKEGGEDKRKRLRVLCSQAFL